MARTDALGDRMRTHEQIHRQVLPRRAFTILRLDGRGFHNYCRGLDRPFDVEFADHMDAVAAAVVAEISGAAFAYVQSDEISVLLTDFASASTEPWFGGVAAKMTSISAARATATMNLLRPPVLLDDGTYAKVALFDSRVFTLSDPHEVAAYFVWRQRDAVKNSISMAAQAHFSHRRLQGLHSGALQELLFAEAGVNWNDYPDGFKRGRVVTKQSATETVSFTHKRTHETHTQEVTRSRWTPRPAPHFTTEPNNWLLGEAIPRMPVAATLQPSV